MATYTDLCVSDWMTANVVSVSVDSSLADAIKLLEKKGLSALPVVDQDGCVCGILSTWDLVGLTYELQCDVTVLPHVSPIVRTTLARALADDRDSAKVSDVMSCDVELINSQINLREAASKLIANQCHHLPVVDDAKKPIGIVSTTDIVRAAAEFQG